MKQKLIINPIVVSLFTCLVQGQVLAAKPFDTPVSSDGTAYEYTYVEKGSAGGGIQGSGPTIMKGESLDSQAEYPAFVLTPSEMAAFAKKYKPVVPRYAKNRPIAETVIGTDARYRLYPQESGYPERAIGLLTFNQGGGSFICTGWLINATTVATAGHCVHTGGPGGSWSTNVRFYPARNGASSPYGSCTAKRLNSVTGWTNSGLEMYDYGTVKLNCSIGNSTGWFGFFWQTATLNGLPVQVSGYPGDKPSGTQWSTSGDIEVSETAKVRYKNDTAGGQSGGPVFQTDRVGAYCTGACVNTIHAYGSSGGRNSGTRINQGVYNNLINWRNTP